MDKNILQYGEWRNKWEDNDEARTQVVVNVGFDLENKWVG